MTAGSAPKSWAEMGCSSGSKARYLQGPGGLAGAQGGADAVRAGELGHDEAAAAQVADEAAEHGVGDAGHGRENGGGGELHGSDRKLGGEGLHGSALSILSLGKERTSREAETQQGWGPSLEIVRDCGNEAAAYCAFGSCRGDRRRVDHEGGAEAAGGGAGRGGAASAQDTAGDSAGHAIRRGGAGAGRQRAGKPVSVGAAQAGARGGAATGASHG